MSSTDPIPSDSIDLAPHKLALDKIGRALVTRAAAETDMQRAEERAVAQNAKLDDILRSAEPEEACSPEEMLKFAQLVVGTRLALLRTYGTHESEVDVDGDALALPRLEAILAGEPVLNKHIVTQGFTSYSRYGHCRIKANGGTLLQESPIESIHYETQSQYSRQLSGVQRLPTIDISINAIPRDGIPTEWRLPLDALNELYCIGKDEIASFLQQVIDSMVVATNSNARALFKNDEQARHGYIDIQRHVLDPAEALNARYEDEEPIDRGFLRDKLALSLGMRFLELTKEVWSDPGYRPVNVLAEEVKEGEVHLALEYVLNDLRDSKDKRAVLDVIDESSKDILGLNGPASFARKRKFRKLTSDLATLRAKVEGAALSYEPLA